MYSRVVDGRVLHFGHEGILFKQSFVLYDKETGTLWLHTTGEAIKGRLKGRTLEFIPCVVTTWGQWKKQYPHTLVLLGRKARGFMGSFRLMRSMGEFGVSVGDHNRVKLYPLMTLKASPVINDTLYGKNIVVTFDPKTGGAAAFERGDRTFMYHSGTMVDQTGRAWGLLTGYSGKDRLKPLPATPWLIRRWKGFYPSGPVYGQ